MIGCCLHRNGSNLRHTRTSTINANGTEHYS